MGPSLAYAASKFQGSGKLAPLLQLPVVPTYQQQHSTNSSSIGLSGSGSLIVIGDLLPVHHVPDVLQVLGPPVLVLQIVGVLPNIHPKNGGRRLRDERLHQWVILQRPKSLLLKDDPPATSSHQPLVAGQVSPSLLYEIWGSKEHLLLDTGTRRL